MKAKLPKEIKVGAKKYVVLRKYQKARRGDLGEINYDAGTILVTTRDTRGNRLAKEEQTETFWHELTHGILRDMGSRLHRDEQFVTRFARRLNKAILSAKF